MNPCYLHHAPSTMGFAFITPALGVSWLLPAASGRLSMVSMVRMESKTALDFYHINSIRRASYSWHILLHYLQFERENTQKQSALS
jgi:hypothetical protein